MRPERSNQGWIAAVTVATVITLMLIYVENIWLCQARTFGRWPKESALKLLVPQKVKALF
jgi:hypothetical protein